MYIFQNQCKDHRHDVVFAIELGVRYPQEVKLSILYTNAINSLQTREVVPSITFRNATNINQQVQVRLVFSDDIHGPYNVVHGEYDKRTSNYSIMGSVRKQ